MIYRYDIAGDADCGMETELTGDWVKWSDVEVAVKDAERYRWMKANEHSTLAMELCMEVPAEDWDAAIDEQIRQFAASRRSQEDK